MIQENDYNIIKPVENLQNVGAMTPIDRQAGKRRRQAQGERRRPAAGQQDLPGEEKQQTIPTKNNDDGQGGIDYRA